VERRRTCLDVLVFVVPVNGMVDGAVKSSLVIGGVAARRVGATALGVAVATTGEPATLEFGNEEINGVRRVADADGGRAIGRRIVGLCC
jgi:hypothetical protein